MQANDAGVLGMYFYHSWLLWKRNRFSFNCIFFCFALFCFFAKWYKLWLHFSNQDPFSFVHKRNVLAPAEVRSLQPGTEGTLWSKWRNWRGILRFSSLSHLKIHKSSCFFTVLPTCTQSHLQAHLRIWLQSEDSRVPVLSYRRRSA